MAGLVVGRCVGRVFGLVEGLVFGRVLGLVEGLVFGRVFGLILERPPDLLSLYLEGNVDDLL